MAVTETITVLFTDLVRSTGITFEISPDDADELLRTHLSVLRKARCHTKSSLSAGEFAPATPGPTLTSILTDLDSPALRFIACPCRT